MTFLLVQFSLQQATSNCHFFWPTPLYPVKNQQPFPVMFAFFIIHRFLTYIMYIVIMRMGDYQFDLNIFFYNDSIIMMMSRAVIYRHNRLHGISLFFNERHFIENNRIYI